ASNGFAENANGKIKAARALSHNCSYETIRVKLVHGGVMVKRRPPHPLSEGQKSRTFKSKSRRVESREEAVKATSLARLMKAREDQDQTKGLIPNPDDNHGWRKRFGSLRRPPAAAEFDGTCGD